MTLLRFLAVLGQLVISPRKGWEDVAKLKCEPNAMAIGGLYPLLGVTACTAFIQMAYDSEFTLVAALQLAVVIFVKYFVTYFLASAAWQSMSSKMIKSGDISKTDIDLFIICSVGLTAIANIIANCIPIELSIVQFLPMFILLIMWAAASWLKVRSNCMLMFVLTDALTVIVPPYVIEYIFLSFLMP